MSLGVFRNREFLRWFSGGLIAGAVGTALCTLFAPGAAWITALTAGAMLALFTVFTAWRYRRIAGLCEKLRRVNAGDYSLDVSESDEGELSILQSEIYKTTLMLREQSERLQKEKGRLAASLSDISHQLKTPLTSMFVLTELLCGADLAEEQRAAFTERLRAQLERLQWLVESLLKLSKLDAGAAELCVRETDPDALLTRACGPVRIPAELKNVALHFETDGAPVRCDPNWTGEAVLNLIKNCVEHTPSGGWVCVQARTNPLYTEITVRDTGPGFDPEDLPLLFTRFYRGKNASASGGVGIGLAMARSIALAQGGTLTACNAPQGGALFTLRLPRTKAGVSEAPVSEIAHGGPS